ncbi:hypothetical protein GOODEAATRI_022899, partial [Goodea atripinnis]
SLMCLSVPTDASADVGRAHAVVTSRTGGHTCPPLLDPVQLQVEEEAGFTGETAVQCRTCRTSCLTAVSHWITTCRRFRVHPVNRDASRHTQNLTRTYLNEKNPVCIP